jgi:hypothetical protein
MTASNFDYADIGHDHHRSGQHAAHDKHQQNRPAEETSPRLDSGFNYMITLLFHRDLRSANGKTEIEFPLMEEIAQQRLDDARHIYIPD